MPKDKLRRLINSLTETEIKFFRQYARRHISRSKAVYLKIFDLMLKQKDGNDELIKNKLNGKLSDEAFVSLKKYLYEMVLKTLVLLREETSIFGEMLKEISAAEVLTEKQLFDDALKKLNRVKAATYDNELFSLSLVASWFEEVIMRTTGYTLTSAPETINRFEKIKELANQILSQIEMSQLFAGYGNLSQSGIVKEEEDKALKDIFNNPLLNDNLTHPLISAQRTYWMMKGLKERYLGNNESSTTYIDKIHDLVNEYPRSFPYHEYLLIFSSYMRVLSKLEKGDMKQAADLLHELKNLNTLSNQNKFLQFRLTFLLELMIMKLQKNHERCLSLIMQYESKAKNLRGQSFNVMEYRNYQAIINYLISKKYFNDAIPFLNGILNDKVNKSTGVSYQIYARIANLIVHYELGNHELIESSVRALDYFIKSNLMHIQIIRHLLRFFRSTNRKPDREEKSLHVLENGLRELIEIPAERVYLYELVQTGWLQQKGILISISEPRPMIW